MRRTSGGGPCLFAIAPDGDAYFSYGNGGGQGGVKLDIDSEITLPAGRVGVLIDTQTTGRGDGTTGKATLYRGNKKTSVRELFGTEGFDTVVASIKVPIGQLMGKMVQTSVKPPNVEDWRTAA